MTFLLGEIIVPNMSYTNRPTIQELIHIDNASLFLFIFNMHTSKICPKKTKLS